MLFDLPTEAQWEYACRAGTATALNSGKNLTGTETCANMAEVGRYVGNTSDGKGGYSQHTKVGSYLENMWGLYDMHGNVAEWCLDWWANNLGTSAKTDPKGATSGRYRLVRGGCWQGFDGAGTAASCRSAYRSRRYSTGTYYTDYFMDPSYAYSYWGFRVVCLPAE
jgi:formylglycine-generating enzyme required for sulfatase activity